MARGVRRTHTEKLQSELSEVRAAISQYEDSMRALEIPLTAAEVRYLETGK